jgi:hypothetical protein
MGPRDDLGTEENRKLLPLLGIKPQFLSHSAYSLVTISAELSWLHFIPGLHTNYLKHNGYNVDYLL